jgi:hypothetical protein
VHDRDVALAQEPRERPRASADRGDIADPDPVPVPNTSGKILDLLTAGPLSEPAPYRTVAVDGDDRPEPPPIQVLNQEPDRDVAAANRGVPGEGKADRNGRV